MTITGNRPDRRRLFELADARRGVFTATEAIEAGFARTTLAYGVEKGEFKRIAQGIYRLTNYPSSPEDRLIEVAAILGPTAVISHESALERYAVCDVSPSLIHVTLPRSQRFRVRSVPDAEIHTTDRPFAERDIVQEHGFRVTSLLRSIVDSARLGTDPKQIGMAIRAGRDRGLFAESDLLQALKFAPQRVRDIVEDVPHDRGTQQRGVNIVKRYDTPRAFENALIGELQRAVTRTRSINDIRREIAFDRVLVRLQEAAPDTWLLKGGVALDYRREREARATKDVDLSSRVGVEEMTKALHDAATVKLGDYFQIRVGEREQPIDELQTYRFNVSVEFADGRPFEKNLKIDVGFADPWLGQAEEITAHGHLQFAGIPPARVRAIPAEQHLAEKIHAYTRTYEGGRESSRVKDIVDMALLVDHRSFDAQKLEVAIETVFTSRGTHGLPPTLPPPPPSWAVPYSRLAGDLPIPHDLAGAYRHVAALVDPVLDRSRDPGLGR